MTAPERLEEWKGFGAIERITERPDPADWCECSYLRHAEALESGPPVEAQETPEARTRREIAALPVPQVGERWYHCDGEPVIVLRVRRIGPTDTDVVIDYLLENRGWREERTLRSWYGYERPGVRRFQREGPNHGEADNHADPHGSAPYPWERPSTGAVRLDQASKSSGNPFSFKAAWDRTAKAAHQNAIEKGWHDEPREDGTLIALTHGELSEGMEALRKGNPPSKKIPGFLHIEEELADAVVRIMDMAELRGWDVGGAIEAKMAYNRGRSHRHGGKAF